MHQTTHVNFAKYIDDNEKKILATLFHPGEIVKIEKDTGKIEILLKNLNHPHNVYGYSDNEYLVVDSDNNRAIVVNKTSLQIKLEFKNVDFSWIQDAVRVDNHLFIASADNCKIVKVNLKNQIIDSFTFSKNYRIFQILPV